MGKYVEPDDVQDRYQGGTLNTDWLERQILDAEMLLFDLIPRLEDNASDRDIERIKYVVSRAVIRFHDNPRGIISETVQDQSYRLSDPKTDDASGLYFYASELTRFRTVPVQRIGTLKISPSWMSGRDA
ncbi:hypothetical protein BJD55_gp188 [Gordonia phage Yvonnetastic]|uniref:Head-to-tail adaptor n=1 Tax=Gordonia phage Yvonnetastic TaxID=1821566 RepID=A0A142K8Z5_9CAUD|nr:hypothetical protein BJD55_gp188 [Gordonia phage Yvonnetastic]AMS02578.1 hypothetical protein SEA_YVONNETASTIC_34 [Gordonia phage Yvonnetastic]